MRLVHLNWIDGRSFKIENRGLWRFEIEEIAMSLRAAGYVEARPDFFVAKDASTTPEGITPALATIRYEPSHHGEIPDSVSED